MSTPGQVAYEAYAAVLHDTVLLEPWRRLLWLDRRAWEAAAQAVLEAFVSSVRPVDTATSIVEEINARERAGADLDAFRRQDTP